MIDKIEKDGKVIDYSSEIKIRKIDKIIFNCQKCGVEVKKEYRRWDENFPYCSTCSRKEKSLQKYGTDNPFQAEEVKEKIKITNLKKYGVENPNQAESIINKRKQTNLKKYGKESYTQTEEYKKKVKKLDASRRLEKTRKTLVEKYGVENPFQIKKAREKHKQSMILNHNVEFPLQIKKAKEKAKQTNIQKYGEDYAKKISKEAQFNRVKKRLENDVELLVSLDEYEGADKTYNWKCKKCNSIFEDNADNGRVPRCKKCYPTAYENGPQKEIEDFVTSLGLNVLTNKRNIIPPLELDIYIPDKNIAIEYHGLYWHSEQQLVNRNPKKYHLNKLELAQEKNIRLIQIFEDEWLYKREIVLNRIKHILGFYERKIGGRQLTIKEISSKEKNDFLNIYHIQGKDNSSIKLGAFYRNELISVMTFGKARIALGNKTNDFELIRFATKFGVLGQGIASKMLYYFIKNYNAKNIITYSDKRWNTGNLYKQIGFRYSHTSEPNYWYVINKQRKHRYGFKKQDLNERLNSFNPKKTEYENMLSNGYDRIWDCGNDVYSLDK